MESIFGLLKSLNIRARVGKGTGTHSMPKCPSAPDYLALTQEGCAPECLIEELFDNGAERVQKAPSAPDYVVLTWEASAPDY